MKQQINLYKAGMRHARPAFSALAMTAGVAVCLLALGSAWILADSHATDMDAELQSMRKMEAAAVARLDELTRTLAARDESDSATGTLSDALSALAQRERLLALIEGQGFGETAGFSRPLRALAQNHLGGLWLTRILVSGPGMRTTLEGRAKSPRLVPEYLLGLSSEGALSGQRFDRFKIERSEAGDGTPVRFSMTSELAEQFAQRSVSP